MVRSTMAVWDDGTYYLRTTTEEIEEEEDDEEPRNEGYDGEQDAERLLHGYGNMSKKGSKMTKKKKSKYMKSKSMKSMMKSYKR